MCQHARLVATERAEAVDETPDRLAGGSKVVWPEQIQPHARLVPIVECVARNMGPSFNDDHGVARIRQQPGHGRSRQARADDHEIRFAPHTAPRPDITARTVRSMMRMSSRRPACCTYCRSHAAIWNTCVLWARSWICQSPVMPGRTRHLTPRSWGYGSNM